MLKRNLLKSAVQFYPCGQPAHIIEMKSRELIELQQLLHPMVKTPYSRTLANTVKNQESVEWTRKEYS